MMTMNNASTLTYIEESNFTSIPNKSSYEYPFGETGVVVSAFVIFTFLVIGLFGNVLTISVIINYRELKSNVFMNFILSLCVSDLISALISWLFLYRRTWGFDRWDPIPDMFCNFYWSADLMTSFVTALHILSFAALRLMSIKFPLLYNKVNKRKGKVWISLIWLVCFLCGFIPAWFIFGPGHPNRDSAEDNARWPACTVMVNRTEEYSIFQFTTYTIFLCAPILGIIIICFLIIFQVRERSKSLPDSRKQRKQQRKEKQAVLQLSLIIVAFLIGYVPFLAYEFWAVQDLPDEQYYYVTDYWFGMTEYFLLRFSECLNPLFYNLGSAKMRKYTTKFLKTKIFRCFHWKPRKPSDEASTMTSSANVTNFGV